MAVVRAPAVGQLFVHSTRQRGGRSPAPAAAATAGAGGVAAPATAAAGGKREVRHVWLGSRLRHQSQQLRFVPRHRIRLDRASRRLHRLVQAQAAPAWRRFCGAARPTGAQLFPRLEEQAGVGASQAPPLLFIRCGPLCVQRPRQAVLRRRGGRQEVQRVELGGAAVQLVGHQAQRGRHVACGKRRRVRAQSGGVSGHVRIADALPLRRQLHCKAGRCTWHMHSLLAASSIWSTPQSHGSMHGCN